MYRKVIYLPLNSLQYIDHLCIKKASIVPSVFLQLVLCWHVNLKNRMEIESKRYNNARHTADLNKERCKERENIKGNREHASIVIPHTTSGCNYHWELGIGRVERVGWEVFKVIGNGWSHPPGSSQVTDSVSSLTEFHSIKEIFLRLLSSLNLIIRYPVVCFKGPN